MLELLDDIKDAIPGELDDAQDVTAVVGRGPRLEIACEGDDDEVVTPPHSADKARENVQADRWPGLLFQGVPEGRQLQNRAYTPSPRRSTATSRPVRRLEAIGAKVIAVGEGKMNWVIMEVPKATGAACSAARVGA